MLPTQANDVVWRIFAAGASPDSAVDAFTVAKGMVNKRIDAALRATVLTEIQGWFREAAGQHWVRQEHQATVADLIVAGAGTTFEPAALWALGAMESAVVEPLVRAQWSDADIDAFCEAVLTLVEARCADDKVLDAKGFGAPMPGARVPREALQHRSSLATYHLIESRAPTLAHDGMHRGLQHLVELVLTLRPDRLGELVARADHPVMRLFASEYVALRGRQQDHRLALAWITGEAHHELVALAILHVLWVVNAMDNEVDWVTSGSFNAQYHTWATELRDPDAIVSAAERLVADLVARLEALGDVDGPAFVGELLAEAGYVLINPRAGRPDRQAQLEARCVEAICGWVETHAEPDAIIDRLRPGLALPPRDTHMRHLGDAAWALRERVPSRAALLAKTVLEAYRDQIEPDAERRRFFLNLSPPHNDGWAKAIGKAVALAVGDPLAWVREQAGGQPLTAWDAEEDYDAFLQAQAIAEHLFFVGAEATVARAELGRPIPTDAVTEFYRLFEAHRAFVEPKRYGVDPHRDFVAQRMVRLLAEHGSLTDPWLLELLGDARLPLRAVHQLVVSRVVGTPVSGTATVALRERFEAEAPSDAEALTVWGCIWLAVRDAAGALGVLALLLPSGRVGGPPAQFRLQFELAILGLELRHTLEGVPPVPFDRLQRIVSDLYTILWGQEVAGPAPDDHEEVRARVKAVLGVLPR